MSRNIVYDRPHADGVYAQVEKGRQLSGFDEAEQKLAYLRGVIEQLKFDCDWYYKKTKADADNAAYMQKQYAQSPQDFSDDHAAEVCAQDPNELYARADILKDGEGKLHAALLFLEQTDAAIGRARYRAEQAGKRTLGRIARAIELMDDYLRTGI